jgi:uncharacterized membrane protein
MIEALSHAFAAVCGQNPGHTWAPGGVLLPYCQRCTGLYVGAGVAALLHLWLRPRMSNRFLSIHGAFLLFMAPFGFHWVAHGPVLRAITGVLFAFAVVTFLWLPVAGGTGERMSRSLRVSGQDAGGAGGRTASLGPPFGSWLYFSGLAATGMLLPLAGSLGGTFTAYGLSAMAAWGALCFAALIVANVGLGLLAALRWLCRLISLRALA